MSRLFALLAGFIDVGYRQIADRMGGLADMQLDPIAAISTAQGQGGIGVIRVSGEGSISIVDKVFRSASGKTLAETSGYTARFGKIYDQDEELDEAVVLVFRAPHSYTGEDVVEISCHGGLYVTKRVLRVVLAAGAQPAGPGEFTKRAFLNGKIDLIKAESVMKIIEATGKSAARAAVAVNDGAVSRKIAEVTESLIDLSARLAVWADYPDDADFDADYNSIKEILSQAKTRLGLLLKNYDEGKVLINGVNTAIVGAPNVGKSTLMNMLVGAERSIVTAVPGTTRDIVEESVTLGDITLRICDTAGIHATKDPVEAIGVDRARGRLVSADLVIFVIDGSRSLTDGEVDLLNSIKENKNVLAVVNKSDLEQVLDRDFLKNFVKDIVKISAKTGAGAAELEKSILRILEVAQVDPSEGILVSERQYFTVKNALEAVKEALSALKSGLTLDAVTVSINSAIDELLVLTGEKATQVVVDEVFSKFCVGK